MSDSPRARPAAFVAPRPWSSRGLQGSEGKPVPNSNDATRPRRLRRLAHRSVQPSTSVVDPLERRDLLSAVLSTDGTLLVTGTDGPNEFTIRLGAEPNKLNV